MMLRDSNLDADGDPYGDGDRDTYGVTDTDIDLDDPVHADGDAYTNGDRHGDGHSNSNGFGDCDGHGNCHDTATATHTGDGYIAVQRHPGGDDVQEASTKSGREREGCECGVHATGSPPRSRPSWWRGR